MYSKSKKVFVIFLIYFNIISTIINAKITNQDIEIGFSPGETANKLVLRAIKEAQYSIDVAAYSFTSKIIALSLIDAHKKGIKVRILADKKSNINKYTAINYLVNHNISVKLNDKYAIMHNKFIIIDEISVQTGSFNYTKNAYSRNAENVIYLKNRSDIVQKYVQEFNRLWIESSIVQRRY